MPEYLPNSVWLLRVSSSSCTSGGYAIAGRKGKKATHISYNGNPSRPVPSVTIGVLLEVYIRDWPTTHLRKAVIRVLFIWFMVPQEVAVIGATESAQELVMILG